MTELAYRSLVWHRLVTQIDAHEAAHHRGVVERLFHPRVRQVEPLLQKGRSTPTGGRPFPGLGLCGSTSAHSSHHGTTCSISSRNIARRVFLVYCSKPVIIARVLCFISQTL